MDNNALLAELLLPNIDKTPDYYEELYPERGLAEGARVTRFAPSPTGYLHIGGLFGALVDVLTAQSTGGVAYLRIEDTDKKREIDDGVSAIINGFTHDFRDVLGFVFLCFRSFLLFGFLFLLSVFRHHTVSVDYLDCLALSSDKALLAELVGCAVERGATEIEHFAKRIHLYRYLVAV